MPTYLEFCACCKTRPAIDRAKIGDKLQPCCGLCHRKARKKSRPLPRTLRGQPRRISVRRQPASLPGQLPLFLDYPVN